MFKIQPSTHIFAPASTIWDALINPAKIKQYLFGTEAESDWQVGSTIYFRGEWEGKKYEDKGIITELIPEKTFAYKYWSSMSGKEDKPENYSNVSFHIQPEESGNRLTVIQENIPNQEAAEHSERNWKGVLQKIREITEK